MEFFRIQKDIPFMRHALKFNILSLATFVLAVVMLVTKGLHFSVEFTGGTLVEVRYEQAADLDTVRAALSRSGTRISTSRSEPKCCTWKSPKPLRESAARTVSRSAACS
jgi:preprotein translocase subunit SecF